MEFLKDLSKYLQLTKTVTEMEGSRINVGEFFSLRFTLTNTASTERGIGEPRIIFKNPYLTIAETKYAKPCLPDGTIRYSVGRNFPDIKLLPGESTSLEFKMTAVDEISDWSDYLKKEWIAKAHVKALLDTNEYFLVTRSYNFSEEIEEKGMDYQERPKEPVLEV